MSRRTAAALTAILVLPLAACSVGLRTEDVSYSIDQPLTALVVEARAASVAIDVGDGPVTVTDPEVTRFFMTIPEACQLILQASSIGSHEAIYTLDMGEPVRISLLAEQMIRLAGKQPGRDIAIVYTGLRPGEKLHETLFHADERYRPTSHPKILQAEPRGITIEVIAHAIDRLREASVRYDREALSQLLREAVPEFAPASASMEPSMATVVAFPARNARRI